VRRGSVSCREMRKIWKSEGEEIATMFNQLCDDGRSSTHLTIRSYSQLTVIPCARCMVKVQIFTCVRSDYKLYTDNAMLISCLLNTKKEHLTKPPPHHAFKPNCQICQPTHLPVQQSSGSEQVYAHRRRISSVHQHQRRTGPSPYHQSLIP
jgi:hypothetical protein